MSMLELMLGAAKEITATSDVITGQAPATAPVGTTMALIEQGLQVFTAIYKRIFRAAKGEYRTLYESIGAWGDPEDYLEVIDDPEADFEADFTPEGKDVVPVSDPTVATKMQQMAKAQLLLGQVGQGLNDREIRLRAFRAFDIDDPETLVPMPQPPPGAELAEANATAETEKVKSEAMKNVANAQKTLAEAEQTALQTGVARAEIDAVLRGLPSLADASDQPMGNVNPQGVSDFARGGVA
jgi:chaperonin GroES